MASMLTRSVANAFRGTVPRMVASQHASRVTMGATLARRSMASLPDKYKFTKSHEWVSDTKGTAKVGITEHAAKELGEIVYLELPDVGTKVKVGDSCGNIESVKAVSEIHAPVAGEITEVNDAMTNDPSSIADDAYGDGWLIKVKVSDDNKDLMDSKAYQKFIDE